MRLFGAERGTVTDVVAEWELCNTSLTSRFESEPIVPRNTVPRTLISQQCVTTIADSLIVATGLQG